MRNQRGMITMYKCMRCKTKYERDLDVCPVCNSKKVKPIIPNYKKKYKQVSP